jgi:O-antigen/teichoic acid export membrane protein
MTRTRAAILNYLSSVALTGTTMAVGLIATPFLVRWLGEERFGATRAATDVIGYLGLLTLGYNAALLPLLAGALNKSDVPLLRTLLAIGIRFFTKVAILSLFVGFILAAFIGRIIHASPAATVDLRHGVLVALVGMLFVPLIPLRTLADVGQETWLINLSLLVQSIVISAIALILAYIQMGITGQFIASVTGIFVFQAIVIIRTRRRVPDILTLALKTPASPEVSQRLRQMQFWGFLLHLSYTIGMLTDNVLVGYFMGATTVASFYLTQRLIVICQTQIQGIAAATWAGLTQLHHAGNVDLFQTRYFELLRLIVVSGLTALTPIVAFNQSFIHIWIPKSPYAGELVTIVASANAILLGLNYFWTSLFDGLGRIKEYARIGMTMGIVNLTASILATKYLGIAGPLLGTLTAQITVGLWAYPLRVQRDFHISFRQTYRIIFRPIAMVLPVAAGMWWIAHQLDPHHWLTLIAAIVVCESVFILFMWFIVFAKSERAFWHSRIHRALLSTLRRPEPARATGQGPA